MALKVVGTGFGRTGTNSLKQALEKLGLGPCHHMYEVRDNERQLPYWQRAAAGELPEWDEVFAEYNACVDWPSARFWREITEHFADAKVVHSMRSEDKWIDSVHATIYPRMQSWKEMDPCPARDRLEMASQLIVDQTFGGRLDDRDHAIAVYRAHAQEVRDTIAPERLLIYDVSEGWEPLCEFLDVPVPASPFPRTNTKSEFQERVAGPSAQT